MDPLYLRKLRIDRQIQNQMKNLNNQEKTDSSKGAVASNIVGEEVTSPTEKLNTQANELVKNIRDEVMTPRRQRKYNYIASMERSDYVKKMMNLPKTLPELLIQLQRPDYAKNLNNVINQQIPQPDVMNKVVDSKQEGQNAGNGNQNPQNQEQGANSNKTPVAGFETVIRDEAKKQEVILNNQQQQQTTNEVKQPIAGGVTIIQPEGEVNKLQQGQILQQPVQPDAKPVQQPQTGQQPVVQPDAKPVQQPQMPPQMGQQPPLPPQIGQQPPLPPQMGQQPPLPPQMGQQPPLPPQMGQQPPLPPQMGQQPPLPPQMGQQPPLPPQMGQQPPLPPQMGQQPPLPPQMGQQPPLPPQMGQQPPLPPQMGQQPPLPQQMGQQPPLPPQMGQQPPLPPQMGQQPPLPPHVAHQPHQVGQRPLDIRPPMHEPMPLPDIRPVPNNPNVIPPRTQYLEGNVEMYAPHHPNNLHHPHGPQHPHGPHHPHGPKPSQQPLPPQAGPQQPLTPQTPQQPMPPLANQPNIPLRPEIKPEQHKLPIEHQPQEQVGEVKDSTIDDAQAALYAQLSMNDVANPTLTQMRQRLTDDAFELLFTGMLNLNDLSKTIQDSGKDARSKLILAMANASKQGFDNSQITGSLKMVSESMALEENNPASILKNIIMLYLPWYPLQEGVGFNLKIDTMPNVSEFSSLLKVFIQTRNYGNVNGSLILMNANNVDMQIQCDTTFPKDDLLERMKEVTVNHTMQSNITVEERAQMENEMANQQAKVNLSSTYDLNPFLLLMAHSFIKNTIIIDGSANA